MNVDSLYLFTGNLEPMVKNRIKRLIEAIKKEVDATDLTFDNEIVSLNTIIQEAMVIPLTGEQKIIVIKNPKFLSIATVTNEINNFIKYLQSPNPSTTIIINAINTKIVKDSPIYKEIQKKAEIIEVLDIEDVEIGGIIIKKLLKEGVTISNEAVGLMIKYLNHDLVRAEHECDKLATYIGVGGNITTSEVELLVKPDFDNNIFDLTKAIMNKNRKETLRIYHELTLNTLDVLGILALISQTLTLSHFTLKMLKQGFDKNEIAIITKTSPGRIHYLTEDIKKFQIDEIDQYIQNLAKLDYEIKTGSVDKSLGLELLLMKL